MWHQTNQRMQHSINSTCRIFRCCERVTLHSVIFSRILADIPGRILLTPRPCWSSATRRKKNRAQINLWKYVIFSEKHTEKEPGVPLLWTEAFTATADCAAGICLSAWASNDLASSLSFLSLAITRHAASCCQNTDYQIRSFNQVKFHFNSLKIRKWVSKCKTHVSYICSLNEMNKTKEETRKKYM